MNSSSFKSRFLLYHRAWEVRALSFFMQTDDLQVLEKGFVGCKTGKRPPYTSKGRETICNYKYSKVSAIRKWRLGHKPLKKNPV